ncbi:MAG TPA: hypothetical protein VFV83_05975 [Chthoniobacteraceae bacterium]|nr:hypothetical protein [Chthoniobacteraceae bacterium]
MSDLDSGKPAWRLGALFLAAFAVIIVFSFRDRARVGELEQFEEISAVGDTTYYRPTNDANAVAAFEGRPLFRIDNDKKEIRDTAMRRVGRDPATGLSIYVLRKSNAAGKQTDAATFFIKIGRNDYVRVRGR